MRRLITLFAVASVTALATLRWLHEGDLYDAVQPVVAEWNAELLARDAGLRPEPSGEGAGDALQEAPEPP